MMNSAESERRFAAQQEFLGCDKTVNRTQPLVSISVTTFQQRAYIRQCLDSILMQRTSFPFEIIIGEDESSDGTREICIEYARAHQERIRLFLRSRSVSTYDVNGTIKSANGIWCRRTARGEFVALCEGDDYWTCPDKLQKQVDFLERHRDCSMSFHNAVLVGESTGAGRTVYDETVRGSYELADLFPWNWIYTASVMYRRSALPKRVPDWYFGMPMFDWPTFILIARSGRLGYIPDVMSAYRVHGGGVWSRLTASERTGRSVQAGEVLLTHLRCDSPRFAEARAALREAMLEYYVSEGHERSAGKHAWKLLRYTLRTKLFDLHSLSRADLRNVSRWLGIVLRGRSPVPR